MFIDETIQYDLDTSHPQIVLVIHGNLNQYFNRIFVQTDKRLLKCIQKYK